MKYDFTSILNRDGMDAIAVNPPMNASLDLICTDQRRL